MLTRSPVASTAGSEQAWRKTHQRGLPEMAPTPWMLRAAIAAPPTTPTPTPMRELALHPARPRPRRGQQGPALRVRDRYGGATYSTL
jgi:hypothetical protein